MLCPCILELPPELKMQFCFYEFHYAYESHYFFLAKICFVNLSYLRTIACFITYLADG